MRKKEDKQTDNNFRFFKNPRCQTYHALNGNIKSSSTINIVGLDFDTYKRWIESQLTPELNCLNTVIHHVRPISSFDVSNNDELRGAFNWKNTQPLMKQIHQQKDFKTKSHIIDYH